MRTNPGSPTITSRDGSPAVGVVVPNYNKSDFVEETLRSVSAQTYHNIELVVVDDGSSDDSVATIERVLEGTRGRLVTVENGGVSRARNLGFQEVRDRVDYLLFLDADDLLEPHALATLVSYMESNPQVVATYAALTLIDEHSVLIGREPYQTRWKPFRLGRRAIPEHEPRMSLASVYARFQLLPSGTLIRRSAFERTAGWDSALCRPARPFHAEDKDMATQLGLLGEIHFFAEALYRYRILPTPHRLTMYDGLKELDQKWWNAPLRRPVRRKVRRAIRFDAKVAMLDVAQAWASSFRTDGELSFVAATRNLAASAARWLTMPIRLRRAGQPNGSSLPPVEVRL